MTDAIFGFMLVALFFGSVIFVAMLIEEVVHWYQKRRNLAVDTNQTRQWNKFANTIEECRSDFK